MLVAAPFLLPDRQSPVEQLENAREYSVEARVAPNGPLVGRSIAEVGLRSMKHAFVLEISRGQRLLTAVGPDEVLQGNDRVTFVGVVDAMNELRRIPGLLVAEDQTYKLNLRHAQRCLVELVLSPSSPLVGQTVRESGFRAKYNAAVISISREGARMEGKLGDVRLRPGDTLACRDGPWLRRTAQVQPRFSAGEFAPGLGAAGFRPRSCGLPDSHRDVGRIGPSRLSRSSRPPL